MELSSAQLTEIIESKIPFVRRMGLKVLEAKPGYVKLTAPLAGNENHVGTMYAGAQFTLAEIPGGALALCTFDPARFYPVVKELTLKFRRPATGDLTVEFSISEGEAARITAETEENGKSDYILEGTPKDAGGEAVATSRGTYQLRAVGT